MLLNLSPMHRALIIIAVMTATLMQVLDTTIVNVALPHMEGSLGANPDQITWILTSYLVASAIFMPLTGYFTDIWGQKKYLLISIGGFVIASALCGAAMSITQIVVFRLLQGVFGAALVPLSQSIMASIFPENERGKAMAIWGIGVMVGPVLGPTIGGYLTEVATWRWNFYINVPIGIACLFLTWQVVPDSEQKARQMDWLGLGYISVAIGAIQYFLDRGNEENWFDSRSICIAAFFGILALLLFLRHNIGRQNKNIVFDLSIFNDRNFALASTLMALFGLGLYGAMVILPLMLEGLLNYPVLTTGLVMAPRGLSAMVSMLIAGRIMNLFDPRVLIFSGVMISILGMGLGTNYNLGINTWWVIGPILIQGLGLGLVFVPLSALAFATLKAESRHEAAGLFSLLRTLGSSIGISIVSTLLARHSQMSWNQLGGFITPYNHATEHYLRALHLDPTSPMGATQLQVLLHTQSQMVAFVNIYAFIAWSFVFMVPLVLLLKPTKKLEVTLGE